MVQHYALSSHALTCALLSHAALEGRLGLGGEGQARVRRVKACARQTSAAATASDDCEDGKPAISQGQPLV